MPSSALPDRRRDEKTGPGFERNAATGQVTVDRSGERIGQGLKGQPYDGPHAWSETYSINNIGAMIGGGRDDFQPQTVRDSLSMAAVIAVLDVRAQDISTASPTLRRLLPSGGSELVEPEEHPLAALFFDMPNQLQTWPELIETLVYHLGITSNGYVVPKRVGRFDITPVELMIAPPARTLPQIDYKTKRIFYRYRPGDALEQALYGTEDELFFWSDQIAHIGQRRIGGLMGMSTMRLGSRTLSMADALQRFQDRLFRREGAMRGVISVPGTYDQDQYDRLKASIIRAMDAYLNRDEPLVIEGNGKWEPTSMTAVESDMKGFFDQMVGEVCRLWRVPQHKVGHLVNVKYENRDSAERSYFKDSLLPLVRMIEERFSLLCLSQQERLKQKLYVEFDRESLELMDVQAVSERTVKQYSAGLIRRDEARVRLGRNPGPGDNVYSNPANTFITDENNQIVVQGSGGKGPADTPADPPKP